uniref:Cytochrome c oxidase subunit 2 n=4 Tax=Pyropia TaxID=1094566 RepID=A0A060D8I4_PYRPE|nr:cytochrome c oxidase subunit 2 [Neoporphyra perforata]AIB08088.1 cytochrome c oxidase subunit 2 [Neoporphyra perforata]AIB08236.1 cytochrome c oxidase subunit 2 [Neoporphyra perforata]AIB08263.1 cytochrome c oxidase subunit 2 [Neoporphyra perforata]AIB08290.1 cytochrome c oxidase subunit 2 [Neoporphyra perforata]
MVKKKIVLLSLGLALLTQLFHSQVLYSDSAEDWQLGFQDPATPIMEGIINLHHDFMFFICGISIFVSWILARTLWHYQWTKNKYPSAMVHGTAIEIIWTVTPSITLLAIAIPSFALLYSMDEIIAPAITIKTVGHQWYWSYEYSDYTNEEDNTIMFESYMIPEEDLILGQLRLLEVDNPMVIPVNTHVRLIITAADVLHSWAVPSLGIKCDAVPGRLNQSSLFVKREGLFYGQCSEICGVNHGFMPIVVEAVSLPNYISWVANKLSE